MLCVDDHRTFTDLVELALAGEPDLEFVGAAGDPEQARRLHRATRPDIVVMDVRLGADDGVALTAELIAEDPALRVVVLTAHADVSTMRRAAAAGACALLPKDGSLPELLAGLRRSCAGGIVVAPELLRSLMVDGRDNAADRPSFPALTPRELLVLGLLDQGRDVRTIASGLHISVSTCRGYVKNVLRKLGAHSQLEAVVVARAHGLIDRE